MNVEKIWVEFGIYEHQKNIPVYQLADTLGTKKSRVLLKVCVNSKIGFK